MRVTVSVDVRDRARAVYLSHVASPVFVLIHSPLVGPFTWQGVAAEVHEAGLPAVVPAIGPAGRTDGRSCIDFYCGTVVDALPAPGPSTHYLLVAHSGAGMMLPYLRAQLPRLATMVFCDADIPIDGKSRFDLLPEGAADKLRALASDGLLPPLWSDDDLIEAIPDPRKRSSFVSELVDTPIEVYEEPVSVPPRALDGTHAFLKFTDFYNGSFDRARSLGWSRYSMVGTHCHPINAPEEVAKLLLSIAASLEG